MNQPRKADEVARHCLVKQYRPPPTVQRATIEQLNTIARRALYQNVAANNEKLERSLKAVEKHTSEVLQSNTK